MRQISEFPDPSTLLITVDNVQEVAIQLQLQIEYKVVDHQEYICGVIAGSLFLPVAPSNKPNTLLQYRVYSSRVNPLLFYNQLSLAMTSTAGHTAGQ